MGPGNDNEDGYTLIDKLWLYHNHYREHAKQVLDPLRAKNTPQPDRHTRTFRTVPASVRQLPRRHAPASEHFPRCSGANGPSVSSRKPGCAIRNCRGLQYLQGLGRFARVTPIYTNIQTLPVFHTSSPPRPAAARVAPRACMSLAFVRASSIFSRPRICAERGGNTRGDSLPPNSTALKFLQPRHACYHRSKRLVWTSTSLALSSYFSRSPERRRAWPDVAPARFCTSIRTSQHLRRSCQTSKYV